MSNKKSSRQSIWRDDGSSSIKNSGASTSAISTFTDGALQAAVAETAATRVDLRVGLDVVLCASRGTALAAGLDAEADLVVGRGSELVRDEVDTLGAAMDVRGLDDGCDTVGGRSPSAVVLLSGRPVGTMGAGTDDSLVTLDSPRTGGGARL